MDFKKLLFAKRLLCFASAQAAILMADDSQSVERKEISIESDSMKPSFMAGGFERKIVSSFEQLRDPIEGDDSLEVEAAQHIEREQAASRRSLYVIIFGSFAVIIGVVAMRWRKYVKRHRHRSKRRKPANKSRKKLEEVAPL